MTDPRTLVCSFLRYASADTRTEGHCDPDAHLGLDEVVTAGGVHIERLGDRVVWASIEGRVFHFAAEKGPHGWQLTWTEDIP